MILSRKARVIAIEADARATKILTETFADEIANDRLILKHADVREETFLQSPHLTDHGFKVVANIPYYLSGMLFRTLLEGKVQPSTLVYLVQKEVAKRATSSLARGEKESLLSLSVKAYGTPEYVKTVSRGHFTPMPNVDSAIIAVRNIGRDNFADLDPSFFFELLHIGFGKKRKQLLGDLSASFVRNQLTHIFSTLSISVSTRAEDLPLQTWLDLARSLSVHTELPI